MPTDPSPNAADPLVDARGDVVLAVLKGYRTAEEAGRTLGVGTAEIHSWIDAFIAGGRQSVDGNGSDMAAIEFVLALAQALHRYGASAYRLEAGIKDVAHTLGLEVRLFSTPTAIMASFGPLHAEKTCLVRVEPGEINLGKLAMLYDVTSQFVQGTVTVPDALAVVTAIIAADPRYRFVIHMVCSGLASAAAAGFFGGGWLEIQVALGIGMVVGAVSRLSNRSTDTGHLLEPVAATLAALLSVAASRWFGPVETFVTTLAGVITLLPGMGFTTAMTELATNNLASGTARFAGAFVQLSGLGVGIALGMAIASRWAPAVVADGLVVWPLGMLALAVIVSSLAYSVILRARPRDTGWILAAGVLAYSGALVGQSLIGPELGALLGAFVVAFASNLRGRLLDQATAVTLVPGILMLVPGSLGMRSVMAMWQNDVDSGVSAAFRMAFVATALVAGILLANVAMPSRRPL
ncbi:MAG: threonine/serine exporter family protein [Candidatus Sericytochromatia bacterium]|nr:threonine/serine exporter family protein [Candidatus Sericytochromatia bacterium]